MVKEIQELARKFEAKGYSIIIIGDARHEEVVGIKGHLNHPPLVVSQDKDLEKLKQTPLRKAAVVVQSTQEMEKTLLMAEKIRPLVKEDFKFLNTICRPTRLKQEEIKSLPLQQEVVVIIGSRKSANTKRLYRISRRLNSASYLVNSKEEIRREWFAGKTRVGITAGASTPDYIIKEITSFISSL